MEGDVLERELAFHQQVAKDALARLAPVQTTLSNVMRSLGTGESSRKNGCFARSKDRCSARVQNWLSVNSAAATASILANCFEQFPISGWKVSTFRLNKLTSLAKGPR